MRWESYKGEKGSVNQYWAGVRELLNWGKYIETNKEYVMQCKVNQMKEEEEKKIRTHTHKHIT